jgi:antitoxin Xre/MbcA/ParS-like protein
MRRGKQTSLRGKRHLAHRATRKARTGSSLKAGEFATGSLVARLIDPAGLIALDRVADTLGLSKVQLAQTVGLNREAFYKASRRRAPKTQARVREMLEIVSRVSEWAGGKEQALAWYRAQPIAAFGGRTAESLVKSGKATAVRDYLDHMAMGGFA